MELDFLSLPNHKRLRKEILNICGSYTHQWDILAELLQNVVDAINKFNRTYPASGKHHVIEIEINSIKRTIRIKDSGTGLSFEKLAECLSPHGTDKDDDEELIGEKGVGLTFAIFSSDKATIKSSSDKGSYTAVVERASAWKKGIVNEIPKAEVLENSNTSIHPQDFFTEITLEKVEKIYDDSIDIFHISLDRLIYIMQTKTAVGYLNSLWQREHPHIDVIVKHTDLNNTSNLISIDFKYKLPSSYVNSRDVINFDAFVQQAATMSDTQKSAKLRGKSLELIGNVNKGGRNINYYAFYVPSRNLWNEIATKNGLYYTGENDSDKIFEIRAGIFLATKGMPTAVELVPPITGSQGYWANLYIILEDNRLDFDLGRKFIPGPTQSMFKSIARDLFAKFTSFSKYLSTDPPVTQQNATIQIAQKNQIFEQLNQINDLGLDNFHYMKYPDGQEAAVVALFNELVGAKLLKGYYSLKSGYKLTYDLWARYIIDSQLIGSDYHAMGKLDLPIVIEFKHDAHKILDDVDSNQKFFIDMDLIICWDIDHTQFNRYNIQVRPLSDNEVFFYGSNYELTWPGAANLGSASKKPVCCLRKFIENLVAQQ